MPHRQIPFPPRDSFGHAVYTAHGLKLAVVELSLFGRLSELADKGFGVGEVRGREAVTGRSELRACPGFDTMMLALPPKGR